MEDTFQFRITEFDSQKTKRGEGLNADDYNRIRRNMNFEN